MDNDLLSITLEDILDILDDCDDEDLLAEAYALFALTKFE